MSGGNKQALVASSTVTPNHGQCPMCQSTTVVVEGYWKRTFVRSLENGRPSHEEVSEPYFEGVAAITCEGCKIRFIVVADDVLEIQRQMMELLMERADSEGLAVVAERTGSKPN